MLLTLLLVSILSYLLIAIAPGDVAQQIARRRAGGLAGPGEVARLRAELGLDDPLPVQYWRWLTGVLSGDLGVSLRTGVPITQELGPRVGLTLVLTLGGTVLAFAIGLALAALGALHPGRALDRLTRGGALLFVSVPSFFVGSLLILVFALQLGWVPAVGEDGPKTWILPCLALALPAAGVICRVVRTQLARAMASPYATTAYSRGASRREVLVDDALRNVAGPALAVALTQVGFMLIGTVTIEVVFGWKGVGDYFIHAVEFRDIPVLQATLLVFAACFVAISALADAVQAAIDPRIRHPRATTS
jgi:ABC-type dipeptide/oligopeptide/nickel transport system permease component